MLTNWFFGGTNTVKNTDKSKYVHSGYRIAFDGADLWSFVNNFARNVAIFGVDNSPSSHSHTCKNNVLVLGEGPTDDTNGSVGTAEQNFSNNFTKAKTNFA